jgi:signal peptidase I
LKQQILEPGVFSAKEGERTLSGQALLDLTQTVLAKGAQFRFCAKGLSMYPFIKNGDLITISPLSDAPLSPGDIVAFVSSVTGKLVVHRVIRRMGGFFSIKGDNNGAGDGETVPKAKILGCVTKVERNGKEVLFGFGPERLMIAFLSRNTLLAKFLPRFIHFFRPIFRRK